MIVKLFNKKKKNTHLFTDIIDNNFSLFFNNVLQNKSGRKKFMFGH